VSRHRVARGTVALLLVMSMLAVATPAYAFTSVPITVGDATAEAAAFDVCAELTDGACLATAVLPAAGAVALAAVFYGGDPEGACAGSNSGLALPNWSLGALSTCPPDEWWGWAAELAAEAGFNVSSLTQFGFTESQQETICAWTYAAYGGTIPADSTAGSDQLAKIALDSAAAICPSELAKIEATAGPITTGLGNGLAESAWPQGDAAVTWDEWASIPTADAGSPVVLGGYGTPTSNEGVIFVWTQISGGVQYAFNGALSAYTWVHSTRGPYADGHQHQFVFEWAPAGYTGCTSSFGCLWVYLDGYLAMTESSVSSVGPLAHLNITGTSPATGAVWNPGGGWDDVTPATIRVYSRAAYVGAGRGGLRVGAGDVHGDRQPVSSGHDAGGERTAGGRLCAVHRGGRVAHGGAPGYCAT